MSNTSEEAFEAEQRRSAMDAYDKAIRSAADTLERRLALIPKRIAASAARKQRREALSAERNRLRDRASTICALYDEGLSYADLARQFGLSRGRIQHLARNSKRALCRREALDAKRSNKLQQDSFARLRIDADLALRVIGQRRGMPAEEVTPEVVSGFSPMQLMEIPGMSHDMLFALKWVLDESRLAFREEPVSYLSPVPPNPI